MPSFLWFDLINESAAIADSFMTSPSFPVKVSFSIPGIIVTSIGRISPPNIVHERPVATPTLSLRFSFLCLYLGAFRYFSILLSLIVNFLLLVELQKTSLLYQNTSLILILNSLETFLGMKNRSSDQQIGQNMSIPIDDVY